MSEIRVENIIGETGTDAVTFSKGLSTTGIVTATNVSVGSSVTAATFHGSGANLTNVSAGKVVGFALSPSFTTEQYVQQSSYQLVGSALTYTATSSSNKLLILHNHSLLIEDSEFWNMALYRDGLSGTQLYERKSYSQDSQWIAQMGINSVVVDISDTSSHTYQFAMYRSGGTNRTVYNYHGGASSGGVIQIILLEIDPT